jgi:hypothetical protein
MPFPPCNPAKHQKTLGERYLMIKMPKWVLKLLCLTIVIPQGLVISTPTTTYSASKFEGHSAEALLEKWAERGLLKWATDRGIQPDQALTRSELIALVNNVMGFREKKPGYYSDIPDKAWYKSDMERAAFIGYAPTFTNENQQKEAKPEQLVSRQDAAFMIGSIFSYKSGSTGEDLPALFTDANEIAKYAYLPISELVNRGYITGYSDKTFRPNADFTLAEAVTLLNAAAGDLLNKEGTYTSSFSNNVTINRSGVTLSHLQIEGDLYLTEGIGSGKVTLDNVIVKGKTFVRGGGEHSIKLIDTKLNGKLIIEKRDHKTRIVAEGATLIPITELYSGARLQAVDNAIQPFNQISVMGEAAGTDVELMGNFDEILINANARATLKKGTINHLKVSSEAKDSKGAVTPFVLATSKESSIATLTAEAPVIVVGLGNIANVVAKVSNVTLEQRPSHWEILSGGSIYMPGLFANGEFDEISAKNNAYTDPGQSVVVQAAESLSLGKGLNMVASNMELPLLSENGVKISWISTHPEVIDSEGIINRPETGRSDRDVLLIATISQGDSQAIKSFNLTIKAHSYKQIDSFIYDGYKATLDQAKNLVLLFLPKGSDLNSNTLTFSTSGNVFLINGQEITNGEEYSLAAEQMIKIVGWDGESREYRLVVDIVDTGLPTVILNTDKHKAVDKDKKVASTMVIKDGNKQTYGKGLFDGEISIKGRGNTSWGMPKKSYAISFPKPTEILDMPQEEDWVLIANYADKSLMRNYAAYTFGSSLAGMAYNPKMRYVELFLNGEYAGNYLLGEKIKISANRVSIHKMNTSDISGESLTGGYLVEKDEMSRIEQDDVYFETGKVSGSNVFAIKEPKSDKITPEQINYISNYFQEAENVLYSDNFTDAETGYAKYFNVDTIIDWYLANELFKNVDAKFVSSVYLYKDNNGKIAMGPIWDFDIAAGNINYNGGDDPEKFTIKNATWISRFFKDPVFVQRVKSRWNEIKGNQVVTLMQLIERTSVELERSQQSNFQRWPILGVYDWPNADGYEQRTTYASEVLYLKDWLAKRIDWLDSAFNKL